MIYRKRRRRRNGDSVALFVITHVVGLKARSSPEGNKTYVVTTVFYG